MLRACKWNTKVPFVIALLSGGVGAARFARGLVQIVPPAQVNLISNVGDDEVLHGLHISPDIDTVIYTLAGAINQETGWGLEGESWRVMEALSDYGGDTWFRLGDRDLATHMFRSQLLSNGETLTEITRKIKHRWGVEPQIYPATNDSVRTELYADIDGVEKKLSFQEYFVQLAQRPKIKQVIYQGHQEASATSEVVETLENADVIIIAPSNPILSIGPMLAIGEITELLTKRRDSVVAVSPIIAGKAVKGPAAKLMEELGLNPSALGIAEFYRNVAGSIVIDHRDSSIAEDIRRFNMNAGITETLMDSDQAAKTLAQVAVGLIEGV